MDVQNKSMIEAKILADSINTFGNRIISYKLTFPRIVLSEFNTHRALSRNSASSRAIPSKKMLKLVEEDPFEPIKWMKKHIGMQGDEFLKEDEIQGARAYWHNAKNAMCTYAEYLDNLGVTKQITNRLLEPFMWHTVIATATEWENFYALRAHPDAEIHIQELAHRMLKVANSSRPVQLQPGEWHIPFGDSIDCRLLELQKEKFPKYSLDELRIMIATARCARVSYLNFEGNDDYEADIRLYHKLLAGGHMSPFEHCAQAMDEYIYYNTINGHFTTYLQGRPIIENDGYGWSGNFRGFTQYRKTLVNENKKDERLIKIP